MTNRWLRISLVSVCIAYTCSFAFSFDRDMLGGITGIQDRMLKMHDLLVSYLAEMKLFCIFRGLQAQGHMAHFGDPERA